MPDCPHCHAEIEAALIKKWARLLSPSGRRAKLAQCAKCETMLTTRQRYRACPHCHYNNSKEANADAAQARELRRQIEESRRRTIHATEQRNLSGRRPILVFPAPKRGTDEADPAGN